jgi:Right handed beta helix region
LLEPQILSSLNENLDGWEYGSWDLPEEVHVTSKPFSGACLILVLMLVAAGCGGPSAPAPSAPDCTNEQVREVLQLATRDEAEIVVNCNLTVPSNFVITKRLIVQGREGSRVTINCEGARIDGSKVSDDELSQENAQHKDMILVRSTSDGGDIWNSRWSRPTDVTVKNCNIVGSVRIQVMTGITQLRRSSYVSGHPERMRHIAPTRVMLDNLTITGRGRNPVYIGSGVTNSKLINSELNGKSDAVALYMDAESSQNLIKNNYIHTVTSREVLAVDGSNFNRIVSNRFSALSKGGIYLYRNCGEKGVVRHTTPSHNTIVNNVFYYEKYSPSPALRRETWVGVLLTAM